MALFDTIRAGASGAADDYVVERSLRFNRNDSARLQLGTLNGNKKTFTISFWTKLAKFDNEKCVFSVTQNSGGNFTLDFMSDQTFQVREFSIHTNGETINLRTNRRFRDPSAWLHVLVAIDTTESTSSDRAKIYFNGTQETSFSTASYPSLNREFYVNNNTDNSRTHIGSQSYAGTSNNFDGYLSEFYLIDGTALQPSDFGKTNALTGQFNPIVYTGSFGTNGVYLNFSDNSNTTSTTLGKDSSGVGNNFTPSNFNVTANSVDNDSVLDTPSNNWCVMNIFTGYWSEGGSIPFSDGSLHVDNPNSGDRAGFATFRLEDGKKYYIEGKYFVPSGGGSQCKWAIQTLSKSDGVAVKPGGAGSFGFDWRGSAGTPQILNSGSSSNIGSQPSNDEVIGMAIDLVNGKIYVHKSNSYYNSGNPDNGTGAIITGISTGQDYQFITSVDSGGPNFSETKINFGQQGFAHQPSSFTDLLNSENLPDPIIPLPTDHFDTLLYVGNNGSQNITGLDFDPDWVWAKNRQAAGYHHDLYDTVRGDNLRIFASQSDKEATGFLQFGVTGGFSLTSGGGINQNGNNHVAWCWNAGDSTVTNNDGDISSQVRANPTAGFSIVSYTGNGGSNQTIGHGLGVTPQAAIYKNRDSNGANVEAQWNVSVNKSVAFRGSLNLTESNQNNSLTNFTSSTFSVASSSTARNANNKKYIAYIFSSVKGYSLVGSFVGNSNNNGAFVFCGFAPAWIMIKKSSGSGNWGINDIKRDINTEFGNDLSLYANSSGAETSSSSLNVDFLSNGFKLRSDNSSYNASGGTYIFLAFAESPFKYARAR